MSDTPKKQPVSIIVNSGVLNAWAYDLVDPRLSFSLDLQVVACGPQVKTSNFFYVLVGRTTRDF